MDTVCVHNFDLHTLPVFTMTHLTLVRLGGLRGCVSISLVSPNMSPKSKVPSSVAHTAVPAAWRSAQPQQPQQSQQSSSPAIETVTYSSSSSSTAGGASRTTCQRIVS